MRFTALTALTAVLLMAHGGCGSDGSPDGPLPGDGQDSGSSGGPGGFGEDGGKPPGCVGLQCQQVTCTGGGTTSVSGTVYDPAGKTPLYNVVVYVPNTPLSPIIDGVSCDRCASALSGNPIATALTDTKGNFKLENVPVGSDIPIVIQVGKWRRRLTLKSVPSCSDTPITDKELTRLPRTQAEGDLPRLAMATGKADALECLLRKIGIADSEFTSSTGTGRVHMYTGNSGVDRFAPTLNGGASFTSAIPFWSDVNNLKKYDLVMLGCEGGHNENDKPAQALQAMFDYASAGGRIFAEHWHNYWIQSGPAPFPSTAQFNNGVDPNNVDADIDMSFPKGKALAEWLDGLGKSPAGLGKVHISGAQHTVDAANNPPAQPWITTSSPASMQYMSFNTPIGVDADKQCGRVVLSDIHVAADGDYPGVAYPYPSGCTSTGMSPQELILEFMLFDISSCIQKDADKPTAPPVK